MKLHFESRMAVMFASGKVNMTFDFAAFAVTVKKSRKWGSGFVRFYIICSEL